MILEFNVKIKPLNKVYSSHVPLPTLFGFFSIHCFIQLCYNRSACPLGSLRVGSPRDRYSIFVIKGIVKFIPSSNTLSTGEYLMVTTIPLVKMNKYSPNNFGAYFGWRGIDIILQTQSQGELMYESRIISKTATSITVRCYMTKVSHFRYIVGNYMLVHEALVNRQLITGG